jgi:hypothetical protein
MLYEKQITTTATKTKKNKLNYDQCSIGLYLSRLMPNGILRLNVDDNGTVGGGFKSGITGEFQPDDEN